MVACNVIPDVTFKKNCLKKQTTMGLQGIYDYSLAYCVLFINVGKEFVVTLTL